MGAHPLFFEERPRGRRPVDRRDLAIPDRHPLDENSTQLLPASRRSHSDRLGQGEQADPVGIERADPIVVGQGTESQPNGVPLRLVIGVGEIAPAVLALESLQSGEQTLALLASDSDLLPDWNDSRANTAGAISLMPTTRPSETPFGRPLVPCPRR